MDHFRDQFLFCRQPANCHCGVSRGLGACQSYFDRIYAAAEGELGASLFSFCVWDVYKHTQLFTSGGIITSPSP